jgi:alkylation response protein AidB-like acyl-CoA dehydrogenase
MAAREDVAVRIEQLLASHPPSTTPPSEFWGAQFDLGLAWVEFPVGLGGLGVDAALQELVTRGLYSAGAPRNFLQNFVGIGMAARVIVDFGTEMQQRLLRPIFTCEEQWCQLFSEPGAGSDLANLSTRAERDVHTPGVEVRPLRQMSGDAEFSEVFLHDVRIPDTARVGPPGEGWRVTIGTLMTERAHNGENVRRPRGFGPIAHAVRLWGEVGDDASCRAARRDRLVRVWSEAEVLRLTAWRAEQQQRGAPGPEGSVLKLAAGMLPQRVFELCTDLLGPRGMLIDDYEMRQPDVMAESNMGDGREELDLVKALLSSRSATIGGGTTEIQKNTIAERVLGLPAEGRIDRDAPWAG